MNIINAIRPYRLDHGVWVFDDAAVGLKSEPFVGEINDMIDALTAHIPNARRGFLCLFSAQKFPATTPLVELTRMEEDPDRAFGGNWYWCEQLGIEGWLCSALLRYFETAPKKIYATFLPKPGRNRRNQQHQLSA